MRGRRGLTLVEVLLVIAILAVLLALLVPAVQKVRALSARLHDQNNIRQIVLGFQSYSTVSGGVLPSRGRRSIVVGPPGVTSHSPLYNILPFLEPPAPPPYGVPFYTANGLLWGTEYALIPTFISPTDPSLDRLDDYARTRGPNCYAVNQQVFGKPARLPASFPDGISATIAVGQHYYYAGMPGVPSWREDYLTMFYTEPSQLWADRSGWRSCTFADPVWWDVLPVTKDGQTLPSIPGATFQMVPNPRAADGRMLQATQSAGLLVGMFDGSVKTISPGVSPATFWAAVTPAGGEAVSEGE